MSEPPKIDIDALENELKDAKEKLEKVDPNLRSNPENIALLVQMKQIKDKLKKADPVKHDELKLILKCECSKTMDVPPEIKTKMDGEEDISGSLPVCECGKTFHISVTA